MFQTKKDKVTGEKMDEEIEMPGSELFEGAYVYEGSVCKGNETGKQLIHKDAMSLSKQRWTPKDKKGTHPELYEEFEGDINVVVNMGDRTIHMLNFKPSTLHSSWKEFAFRKKGIQITCDYHIRLVETM